LPVGGGDLGAPLSYYCFVGLIVLVHVWISQHIDITRLFLPQNWSKRFHNPSTHGQNLADNAGFFA
jgi:hypothetical protein